MIAAGFGRWTIPPVPFTKLSLPFGPVQSLNRDKPAPLDLIGSDAAWASDPKSGGLARLDLATRAVTIWFTVGAKALNPIGFDLQGHPIVSGGPNYNVPGSTAVGAWIVTSPGVAEQIAPDGSLVTGTLADTDGVWLMAGYDLYLVSADGRLAELGVRPQSSGNCRVRHPCGASCWHPLKGSRQARRPSA